MERKYMIELTKLMLGLMERNIPFEFTPIYGGGKVEVADHTWDAICHGYSYGGDDGLLEIMGKINENPYDKVEGWLTAEDVLNRADKNRD